MHGMYTVSRSQGNNQGGHDGYGRVDIHERARDKKSHVEKNQENVLGVNELL